jgi:hypothetical protein
VLDATGADLPRICFPPTAGGDNSNYVVKFYGASSGGDCVPSHLPLFNRQIDDVRAVLLAQVVYVGGGSTVNLLAVWRAHGIDLVLREARARGHRARRVDVLVRGRVTASFGSRLEAPELAAEDGVALHFVDAVVASRRDRRAYRVGIAGDRVVEAPLPVVLAGGQAASPARRAAGPAHARRSPRRVSARGEPSRSVPRGPTSGGR